MTPTIRPRALAENPPTWRSSRSSITRGFLSRPGATHKHTREKRPSLPQPFPGFTAGPLPHLYARCVALWWPPCPARLWPNASVLAWVRIRSKRQLEWCRAILAERTGARLSTTDSARRDWCTRSVRCGAVIGWSHRDRSRWRAPGNRERNSGRLGLGERAAWIKPWLQSSVSWAWAPSWP